jgi:hypothetical protein
VRILTAVITVLIVLAAIALSVAGNARVGYGFGASDFDACLSAGAYAVLDLMKSVAPLFITFALPRGRRCRTRDASQRTLMAMARRRRPEAPLAADMRPARPRTEAERAMRPPPMIIGARNS